MLYNDLELPVGIRQAIQKLADAGMTVVTEMRMDDCKKVDGTRFRTFTLQGRYALALIIKRTDDLKPIGADEPPDEPPAEILPEGSNFWLDRSQWHRMSGKEFYPLVVEECLGDLADAPPEVQADVKEKFDRLCDSEDWPLP
jgi:DNA-directed RNA polymerase subunit K/omega